MHLKSPKEENHFLLVLLLWMLGGGALAAAVCVLMHPQAAVPPIAPLLSALFCGGIYATERWSERSRFVSAYADRLDARFYMVITLLLSTVMVFPAVFSVLRAKAKRRRARNAAPWEQENRDV